MVPSGSVVRYNYFQHFFAKPSLTRTAVPLVKASISAGLKSALPVASNTSFSSTKRTSSFARSSESTATTCRAKAVFPASTKGAASLFITTRSLGGEMCAWSRRAPSSLKVNKPSYDRSVATLLPASSTWLTLPVRDKENVTVSGKSTLPAPAPN